MTLELIKPAGWDPEDVLTSDEMNAFQEELVKAIDGVDGGEYAIAIGLVLNGPGQLVLNLQTNVTTELVIETGAFLQLVGTLLMSGVQTVTGDINVAGPGGEINLQSSGRLDVQSGGIVRVESGGDIDVESGGEVNVKSGGRVDVESGGIVHVLSGGDLDLDGDLDVGSTGRINLLGSSKILGSFNSEIQVFDADDLTINNSSVGFRVALTAAHVEETTPGDPSWSSEATGTWLMKNADGLFICFPLLLRPGDVITSLRMTLDGGAGAGHGGTNPTDMPQLQLVRVSTSGVLTVVQTTTDPVTGASYNSVHSVTMSGGALPYTVTSDVHLVRVRAEGPTGGVAFSTRLCSIDGTLTAKGFRGATEVY